MGRERRALWAVVLGFGAAALGPACNAAVGGGMVALVGGAGYLASQCYDCVRVRVLDPESGLPTCDAEVVLSDGESERSLRPCFHVALTEGRYRITARRDGYLPAATELVVEERSGDCPHYTHSVELALRAPGDAPATSRVAPPVAPVAPEALPAPETPPPEPPPVPTGTFEAVVPPPAASPDAGAGAPQP